MSYLCDLISKSVLISLSKVRQKVAGSTRILCSEDTNLGNFRMSLILFFLMSCCMRTSTSTDSLGTGQSIRDGETLVSAGGSFELGFFSPGTSTSRYLGVSYRDASGNRTVVWVANRERPLHNTSGVLKFSQKGILRLLLNDTSNTVWSSNISSGSQTLKNNPVAQLLDSGNLVVKNGQKEESNFLWQSFDYPSDTFLPGMKLGWNLTTGLERYLSCWKSADNPAVGEYSMKIDPRGYPQLVQMKGSAINTRGGSWNGLCFTGYPSLNIYRYEFVLNKKEVYFEFEILDKSIFSLYRASPAGYGERFVWNSQTRSQVEVTTNGWQDACEKYAFCGPNSICNIVGNIPTCKCLKGFVPKFPEQWNISYWSNGCVRRTALDCNNTDGFLNYPEMKLPDTSLSWFNKTMNLEECRKSCLQNCSCTAYANLDIRNGGSGCLLWFDYLVDMRQFFNWGQDLYIKVYVSELDPVAVHGHRKSNKKRVGITVGAIIFGLTICTCIMILKRRGLARMIYRKHYENILRNEDNYLATFDLPIIMKATGNFSNSNKLGEGGFGPVYKGILTNGQEIAVKKLSKSSRQGLDEFKNEVVLIAKLQHRNLVKLLGCCIQEEVMLIYEYMPNKSLDCFILDQIGRQSLDWMKRFNIITGIARGLLYLHQDSRLRIIHRDLKTSNILLDANLAPKISDFGLARILLGDQIEANTNRVAGTYGYMPPEYVVRGRFSMKSDVFSYGVMVLEIISGKKNTEFSDPEYCHNLLGHAWRLWTEGRQLEVLDEVLRERYAPSEVVRCIQVGLLCVQESPHDRPDMSSVVLMLNGDKLLPKPKAPGFYAERDIAPEADALLSNCKLFSPNEISVTMLEGR